MKIMLQHSAMETRSEVLFAFAELMIRRTRSSWETFAMRAVEWYQNHVPAGARTVQFKDSGDAFARAKMAAQQLKRWTDPEISARIPVDFEEAWVNGLSEPYCTDCKRELVRRYGFLAAPIPPRNNLEVADGLMAMSALSSDFGDTMKELAAIIADNQINDADREHAGNAIRELEALIAAATSVMEQLKRI